MRGRCGSLLINWFTVRVRAGAPFFIAPTSNFLNQPPDILLFFGHLHPVLVHLPIGMLTLLAVLELAAWFPPFKNANASAGFIIALAAPLAVIAAVCGWLLSLEGGYDETLLAWHKWL